MRAATVVADAGTAPPVVVRNVPGVDPAAREAVKVVALLPQVAALAAKVIA